jgi:hypothetical protein
MNFPHPFISLCVLACCLLLTPTLNSNSHITLQITINMIDLFISFTSLSTHFCGCFCFISYFFATLLFISMLAFVFVGVFRLTEKANRKKKRGENCETIFYMFLCIFLFSRRRCVDELKHKMKMLLFTPRSAHNNSSKT